jgi:hypothetical protein
MEIEICIVSFLEEHIRAVGTLLGLTDAEVIKQLEDTTRPMLDELDRAFFEVTGVYPCRKL